MAKPLWLVRNVRELDLRSSILHPAGHDIHGVLVDSSNVYDNLQEDVESRSKRFCHPSPNSG